MIQMDKIQTLNNFTPYLVFFFQGWDKWTKDIKPRNMTCHAHVVLPWHFGTGGVMPLFSSGFEYFVHLRRKRYVTSTRQESSFPHKKPPQHGWPWKSHSALAGLSDCKNCSFRLLFGLASSCLLLLCFWTLMKGKSLILHHQNNAFCLLAAFFSFRRRSTAKKKLRIRHLASVFLRLSSGSCSHMVSWSLESCRSAHKSETEVPVSYLYLTLTWCIFPSCTSNLTNFSYIYQLQDALRLHPFLFIRGMSGGCLGGPGYLRLPLHFHMTPLNLLIKAGNKDICRSHRRLHASSTT